MRIAMTSALDILQNVTTGTITTMLLKKGIRRSWMAGAMPFGFSGRRIVGPAFTLRFVPVREDLATPESWSKPISTRGAIALYKASQASAAFSGRGFVLPEDVRYVAPHVLCHRLSSNVTARSEDTLAFLEKLIERTPVPLEKL
jgi:hypothetical protein